MNCANHPGVAVSHYCRTCGKPLCAQCSRDVQGVIYCENCLGDKLHGVAPGVVGTTVASLGPAGPHPAVAGILAGFFPFGVGAVYTGQYAKGLAHLVVFTLLIFGEVVGSHNPGLAAIFGIAIAFFYVYQIIDAVRSAWAVRLGVPPPDPFGLSQSFGGVERVAPAQNVAINSSTPAPLLDNSMVPGGAIVLIALGILFLLGTTGLFDFDFSRIWPFFLIFIGVWMFLKRWGLVKTGRYRCYCDRCKMRGVMGAAVLTTIGVISLLGTYGHGWDRGWPILLIVIGLVMILQRSASSAGHVDYYPPSGTDSVSSPPPVGGPSDTTNTASPQASSSSEVNHG